MDSISKLAMAEIMPQMALFTRMFFSFFRYSSVADFTRMEEREDGTTTAL